MNKSIQFWFEFASPYSYLAAMRIEKAAAEKGVDLIWRPFLLGAIFKKDLGYTDSPFNRHEKKFRYLWMDVDRQARARGLPETKIPDPFPQNGMLPARVACLLAQSDQIAPFVRAIYEAHFQAGKSLMDRELIVSLLERLGLNAEETLSACQSPENKQQLRLWTEEADRLGIFGAPSFVTSDKQLFWGDDRLEEALDWAKRQ